LESVSKESFSAPTPGDASFEKGVSFSGGEIDLGKR
jgi:hypothetical protein